MIGLNLEILGLLFIGCSYLFQLVLTLDLTTNASENLKNLFFLSIN